MFHVRTYKHIEDGEKWDTEKLVRIDEGELTAGMST
jgi:hypothetical protein